MNECWIAGLLIAFKIAGAKFPPENLEKGSGSMLTLVN